MKKVSNNNVSVKPDTLDSKQDLNDVLSSRKDQLKIDQRNTRNQNTKWFRNYQGFWICT